MKTNATDITFVLDRSGSMQSLVEAAIAGFNRFVDSQRDLPGDTRLTLVQFDNEYEVCHAAAALPDVPALTDETFVPRGTTALLDALARSIDDTGTRLAALPEAERPEHVIFVVFTDGLENASRRFTLADINERITHQRTVYSWDFLFLGANQDAIATAARMGIPRSSAATYAGENFFCSNAFDAISASTSKKRRRETLTTEISEADRDDLM